MVLIWILKIIAFISPQSIGIGEQTLEQKTVSQSHYFTLVLKARKRPSQLRRPSRPAENVVRIRAQAKHEKGRQKENVLEW